MSFPRHRRPAKPKTVLLVDGIPAGAIPNPEPAQVAAQVIERPAPPAETAVTEVISDPPAQAAPTEELAAIATEDARHMFGGRPLSSSVVVRQAYLDANPGPEQIFEGIVADLDAAYLINPALPGSPRTGAAAETAEDTEDPGSGSAPPVDEAAAETSAPASVDPEPVSAEDGEGEPVQDEPAAEPDCAEGADA